jgi:hypothetical protein
MPITKPQINTHLSEKERLAILETNQAAMQEDLNDKVSKDEFGPVKLIAYGLAAIVMTSVAVSLIGHVIIAPK